MKLAFFDEKISRKGLKYDKYTEITLNEVEGVIPENLERKESKHYANRKINLQRSKRINNHFQPSEGLVEAIKSIEIPQLWMVITESWCGDSAQNLPIIAMAAELNDKIDLRIIFRDSNPDIMDQYLSEGKTRSIPILVAFDTEGNEIFRWGPRPATAKQLVGKLTKAGYSKDEFLHDLHLWYGKNRGKETDMELTKLIRESAE